MALCGQSISSLLVIVAMCGQSISSLLVIVASAGSRLRGARGIYYPQGPFAADLQRLPLQRMQEKQWGQKDKLSRDEIGYTVGWQF